jgi:hypothetical protein
MRHGREIAYQLDPGVPPREAAIFLAGSAFGILLHQRRQFVLHASAVEVNGKAVLFCGPSGAGKSTLAAALMKEGRGFVTDDVCLMAFDDADRPHVLPDGRMLKLWDDALGRLAFDERKGESVREGIGKFYLPAEGRAVPAPPAAIYVLRVARPPLAPGIEKIATPDAAALLQANNRPLLAKKMGLGTAYFFAASKLLRHSKVFYLTRALDFDAMGHVTGWLGAHWRELGLCS